MLSKKRKCSFSLLLCFAVIVSLMTMSVFATEIKLFDDGLSISDTKDTLAADGSGYTATAQGQRKVAVSNTITFKNLSGKTKKLIFSYSADCGWGSHTFGNDSGTKEVVLSAGGTVDYTITAYTSNFTKATVTFSSIRFEDVAETTSVTVEFDSTLGSVTVGGAAATSGMAVTGINPATDTALVATVKNGASFIGWFDASGNLLTQSTTYTKQFSEDTSLKALFTTETMFWVDGVLYDDLNNANTAANGSKTIILANTGTLPTGNYTISAGVTLLIPNDSINTVYTSRPGGSKGYYVSPSTYRTLTMASGANITVNGAISIAGMQGSDMNYTNGNPCGPLGYINMNEGSKITVNSGANLYAWGYITGTGAVEILNGGTVYEDFQIADWRGGSVTKDMVGKSQGVFPLSQYYVQNIQVPMTLHAGAYERVCGAVTITLIGLQHIEPIFIGNGGMFVLSSGTLTKDYDEATDRLICTVDGDLSLSNLIITLQTGLTSLSQITIDSADYTLPLNSNITLEIKSGSNLTVSQDIAVLPGSKVIIEEDANVVLGSGNSVYVYDADNWGKFCYYKSADHKYRPIYAVAGTRVDRSADLSKDAEVLLNGTFDGSAGTVYTTLNGANIRSTGNGKIILNTNSATETYQFSQVDTATDGDGYGAEKYVPVSIVSAMLKNENGNYVETTSATYNYDHHNYCCGTANCAEQHGVWYAGEHTYKGSEECSCGGHAAVKIIPKSGNERFFSSLSAACEEFTPDDSYIQMLTGTTEPGFTINKNIYLDLNGQDVKISEGKLTIATGYTLYGMDTATNGFTSDTADKYGEIIGTVSGTVAPNYRYDRTKDVSGKCYVASTKDNLSFHRFDMGVTDYTFYGSGNTGEMVFNMVFKGDTLAKAEILKRGVWFDSDYDWSSESADTLTGGISGITGGDFTTVYTVKAAVMLRDTDNENVSDNPTCTGDKHFADRISFQSAMKIVYNGLDDEAKKAAFKKFADANYFSLSN